MSLDGTYDEANIFAKIIRGEAPCAKIYEDGDTLAFLDLFPQTRGHALVISKTARARNLLDIDQAALAPLMASVQKVGKGLVSTLKPDGLLVMQFNGAPAGQTVFHLHFHLVPRYEGVPMAGHGTAKMADPAELGALAKEIAAGLG